MTYIPRVYGAAILHYYSVYPTKFDVHIEWWLAINITDYTSANGSGRRYYILPMKFLSFLFFSFFFFRRRISEMALPTGNLSSSDGGIWV